MQAHASDMSSARGPTCASKRRPSRSGWLLPSSTSRDAVVSHHPKGDEVSEMTMLAGFACMSIADRSSPDRPGLNRSGPRFGCPMRCPIVQSDRMPPPLTSESQAVCVQCIRHRCLPTRQTRGDACRISVRLASSGPGASPPDPDYSARDAGVKNLFGNSHGMGRIVRF